ncbi:tRNA lysidine(34) synthetase TilS [Hydrogenivirga sp.]
MKELSKLLRKVIGLQKKEKLVPPGSSVLVALSGGVDSVVLTHALLELREFFRLGKLALAHFNHKLRREADEEEEFCRDLAKELGLEIYVGSEEVREVARREKRNLEEVARELRYEFLREVKGKEGFELIATAHHLNDLVETALLWLVRGAGLEGFIGFEPKEGDIVRPLYEATREEILSYAKAKGLRWVEDMSNKDPRFFRNRLRHEVIPVLKSVNPNLEETFLRTRTILRDENDLLEIKAKEVLNRLLSEECLEVKGLSELHPALQRRVLKRFTGVRSFTKIEQVRNLLKRGGEVSLGEGLRAVRRGKLLCLKKDG